MDVIRLDHSSADGHLDRILAPTIFSVRTSRRLFRGMVGLTETQSWQRAFQLIANKSRWDLTVDLVEDYMGAAFQLVMEVLSSGDGKAGKLDPSGESSLGLAKRMRLDVVRSRIPGDYESLRALAHAHFGLPQYDLSYWQTSAAQRPWRGQRDNGAAARTA